MTVRTYFGAAVALTISGGLLYKAHQKRETHKLLAEKENTQTVFLNFLQQNQKNDTYKNCIVDLSQSRDPVVGDSNSFKQGINRLVDREKSDSKHMVVFKLSPEQSSLYQPLIESGFSWHQANREVAVLTKCLAEHRPDNCNYPRYRPIMVGVTAVVFNKTLDKVLLVQEQFGPAKGKWKPPTGTVEYETGENPLQGVVRELEEETGVKLAQAEARLTSCYYANNGIPDHNYTYVFQISDEVPLNAQEGEISKVAWQSVATYLNEKEEKPWIMRTSVAAAFEAVKRQTSWKPSASFFSSGKPITVLSTL